MIEAPYVIASDASTISGDYVGTGGLSGMMDKSQVLHLTYWSNGNHITYRSYNYDPTGNIFSAIAAPTQVDTDGNANHPALAISPLDGSVTVAWLSGVGPTAKILARVRSVDGSWSNVQAVSTAIPWTSTYFGLN